MSAVHNHPSQRRSARSNGGSAASEKPLPATLRELHHERELTLTQAAARTGLHKARLSELERGLRGPSYDELHALGRFYGRLLCVRLAIVVHEAGA